MRSSSLISLCAILSLILNAQIYAEEIRHSYFVAGAMTGIVGEDGKVVWDSGKAKARDGYVLPNGNTLICWMDEIREYDPDKNIIWTREIDKRNQEFSTVVRLPDGRTMFTELGREPRLIEIDENGEIVVEVPLQPDTNNFHMQTRMARKLPNGNYLVPHLFAYAVKEYTPKGEVVNVIPTDRYPELGPEGTHTWPFTAIRLEDGNTLINLTHSHRVIEVDSKGEIVWQLSNDDFEGDPIADACGGQRLPNGNTVIASYAAREPGQIRMFEVTRDKKIVWSQSEYNAHHFQILTTNGEPIPGTPMK